MCVCVCVWVCRTQRVWLKIGKTFRFICEKLQWHNNCFICAHCSTDFQLKFEHFQIHKTPNTHNFYHVDSLHNQSNTIEIKPPNIQCFFLLLFCCWYSWNNDIWFRVILYPPCNVDMNRMLSFDWISYSNSPWKKIWGI